MSHWQSKDRVMVVAEIGANHGSDPDTIWCMVRDAAKAGADAVKVQVYTAEGMALNHPLAVCDRPPWFGVRLRSLYDRGQMSPALLQPLVKACVNYGIDWIASVFDLQDLDAIRSVFPGPVALKIASAELVDRGLIRRVANYGLPLMLSTGMASEEEIRDALEWAKAARHVTLMHCVANYPTRSDEANLPRLGDLAWLAEQATMPCQIGFSDHTKSVAGIPAAAVAFGARVIEKHFGTGPLDGEFSLQPPDFTTMVRAIREAEQAQVSVDQADLGMRSIRRSLWLTLAVRAGTVLTPGHVRSLRGGSGMPPKHLEAVVGQRIRHTADIGPLQEWMLNEQAAPAEGGARSSEHVGWARGQPKAS